MAFARRDRRDPGEELVGPLDSPTEISPFDPPAGASGNGLSWASPPPSNGPDPSPPPGSILPPPEPLPPSAGPIPGAPSAGNGMGPSMPEDALDVPNGMSEGELPEANLPSLGLAGLPPSMPSADELEWSVPTYEVADTSEARYALESRAESIHTLAYGDAVRRGETDYLRTGKVDRFADRVSGEEKTKIDGLLLERTGRGSRLVAQKSETTVHGRMSISAVGWKSNPFSGEDSILLGGALTDTWTGGLMIASAMSDDMAIGIGTRLTAPVDMWLNQLTGMEERPGTSAADGVMVDLAGTLFEREYGVGTHETTLAMFSGAVYQTQRLGFWPMMRVAVGVRNLLPGAGGPAAEQAPPSPPPTAAAGAAGVLVVTNMTGGAAGSLRSGDALPDALRAAGAAEDMEEISNLHHADAAVQLDELSAAARAAEAPNGMGAAPLPPASLPDGFNAPDAMAQLDDLVEGRISHLETLEGVQTSKMDQINAMIGDKLDELAGLSGRTDDAAPPAYSPGWAPPVPMDGSPTLPMKGPEDMTGLSGEIIGNPDAVENLDAVRRAQLEAEMAKISWPGLVADTPEARRLQIEAEIDALMAAKAALEAGDDPIVFLRQMAAQSTELHGAADPRTVALLDAASYYARIDDVLAVVEDEVDLYMLARAQLDLGNDPRVAVQNILNAAADGSDTQRHAQGVLDYLNANFDWGGTVAGDGMVRVSEFGSVDVLPGVADPSPPRLNIEADEVGGSNTVAISRFGSVDVLTDGLGDEGRRLLDLDPGQAVDVLGDGVADGVRFDGTVGFGDVRFGAAPEAATSPVAPQMDEFGPRWVRVEEADLPAPGTFERVIMVDEAQLPVPDNYEIVRLPEDNGAGIVTVSDDTQAVLDATPIRRPPEGADWHGTFDALNADYLYYRRESAWRVMAEYEGAVDLLRDDLRRAITEFGGDAGQYSAQAPVTQLYNSVQELLSEVETAEEARRIQEFLDGFDARTYDVYTDFAQRGDEFEGIRSGATFRLDRHIDQDKLTDWLDSRFADAMANADPANQLSRDEVAFYQQAHLAAKEGRNPLQDLGDQIAYLMGKYDPNVPIDDLPEDQQIIARQVQNFQRHQAELVEVLSDPAFHKTAAAMGDDTYAPVLLRPDLGEAPPPSAGEVRTPVFDPDVQQPAQLDGGVDNATGDYAANQQVINERVGTGDYAAAPELRPAELAAEPEAPSSILARRPDDNLYVNFDESRLINHGPEGEFTDEAAGQYARATRVEARREGLRRQGAVAEFMNERARLRTPEQLRADAAKKNSYAAARVDAANQMWQAPPANRPRRRANVRFGAAEMLTVAADADDLAAAKAQKDARYAGDAELTWWRGSGVNRAVDPLNTDEAIRHVPTPRNPGDRRRHSTWAPSRVPGFGRQADAPGAFPFNARERMLAALMQGSRLDAGHIDLLQGTLADAMRADSVQHGEWLKMTALIGDLRHGDVGPIARTIDWKTLRIMLDMADAAAAVV